MFHHVVSYRRSLVLILCTILFLETQADSDICNICNCNSLKSNVDCAKRNLTSIPQPIPTNVVYLYLRNNKISRIQKEMFQGLHRLQELGLGDNNISTIKEGVFTRLSNLKTLDLSGNKISRIEKEMFQDLHNLEIL
ncbi:leucine-rich repeat-containing protein 4-like [Octopus sinensis]|uniref:Leucine-rich repeat-containing protein 4-like n=1 Tax=Octopus sinensis TaxID=2607531 RepID=A0A6P7TS44_9MOLL|nr:leucine-rich repeat-containing protein 4-like [Octopus sinensis]